MRKLILFAVASAILGTILAGCGESEESKRNLAIIAREAEARRIAGERPSPNVSGKSKKPANGIASRWKPTKAP